MLAITTGSILHTWIYNQTNRSILVGGILMHFTQNLALIFLGGIFGKFNLPPAFWPVWFVFNSVAAFIIVRCHGLEKNTLPDSRKQDPLHSGIKK